MRRFILLIFYLKSLRDLLQNLKDKSFKFSNILILIFFKFPISKKIVISHVVFIYRNNYSVFNHLALFAIFFLSN